MSITILAEVWQYAPVSGGELLVLMAIADAADDDRRMSWLSVPTIAKRSRMKERNTYNCLKSLTEAGLIEDVNDEDAPHAARRYPNAVRRVTERTVWETVSDTPANIAPLHSTAPNPSSTTDTGSRDLEELRSSGPARKRAKGRAAEVEDDPQSYVLASLEDAGEPEPRAKRDPFAPRTRQKRLGPADNLVRYWSSAAAPYTSEKISPTNQRELRGSIQRWLNEGTDYAVIVSMISAYWDPTFQRSDHVVAWKDFLAKRDVLAAAGRKEAELKQAQDDRYDESKW